VDADSHTTTTFYNAFGELRLRTDANGRSVRYDRDALGRCFNARSICRANQTATYNYDSGRVSRPGAAGVRHQLRRVLSSATYDALSRVKSEVRRVDGVTMTMTQTYDTLSRPDITTYPRGAQAGLAIQHVYDATTGDLASIKDITGGKVLWTAIRRDAEGRLREELMGDARVARPRLLDPRLRCPRPAHLAPDLPPAGMPTIQNLSYSYYANATLKTRTDGNLGMVETFDYDSLERLTTWTIGSKGTATYGYDDAATCSAATSSAGLGLANVAFTYTGGTTGGPNAIKHSVIGTTAADYTYYANGAQKSGGKRTNIDYQAYDLPRTITTAQGTFTFAYDAAQARAEKKAPGGTTRYFGTRAEHRTIPGQTISHVFHVFAERPVADVVWQEPATGTTPVETVLFLHQDNLGFRGHHHQARRRHPGAAQVRSLRDARQPTDLVTPAGAFTRAPKAAFTGQDEDDDLGLVNMKGRIYDPSLMRFLSTDPMVGNPVSGQRWNPYSYVVNSPTNLVGSLGPRRRSTARQRGGRQAGHRADVGGDLHGDRDGLHQPGGGGRHADQRADHQDPTSDDSGSQTVANAPFSSGESVLASDMVWARRGGRGRATSQPQIHASASGKGPYNGPMGNAKDLNPKLLANLTAFGNTLTEPGPKSPSPLTTMMRYQNGEYHFILAVDKSTGKGRIVLEKMPQGKSQTDMEWKMGTHYTKNEYVPILGHSHPYVGGKGEEKVSWWDVDHANPTSGTWPSRRGDLPLRTGD
jgi:RHS repeat-associated protein